MRVIFKKLQLLCINQKEITRKVIKVQPEDPEREKEKFLVREILDSIFEKINRINTSNNPNHLFIDLLKVSYSLDDIAKSKYHYAYPQICSAPPNLGLF